MSWSKAAASWYLMAFLSVGVALYALVAYTVFPLGANVHPEMGEVFRAHPVGLYLHVFGAIFALVLGPFQFVDRIRLRHAGLHRGLGWAYLVFGVLAGGIAGLYMSQFAHGGPLGQVGFGALALAWLYTGARAFDAIRRKDVAEHRRWMIRNYALAYAAVMLRLYLPAAVLAGADFTLAYAVIAWMCWVPNVLFAEWLLRARGKPTSPPPPASPQTT